MGLMFVIQVVGYFILKNYLVVLLMFLNQNKWSNLTSNSYKLCPGGKRLGVLDANYSCSK